MALKLYTVEITREVVVHRKACWESPAQSPLPAQRTLMASPWHRGHWVAVGSTYTL